MSTKRGNCAITGQRLRIGMIEIHHKNPIKPIKGEKAGTDETSNLYPIYKQAHDLIRMVDLQAIKLKYQELKSVLYYAKLKDRIVLEKLNKFRKEVGNNELTLADIGAR